MLHCFDHNALGNNYLIKGSHSSSPNFKVLTSPKASPTNGEIVRTTSTWANFTKENFRTEA